MNILVCIKQTFDSEAKIMLADNGQIDGSGVHLVVNPYDEYAIEEAVRLKEMFGGEVVVLTMGSSRAQEALRTALAMGADKGILISVPELAAADEWAVAEVLAKAAATLPYDVILAGRVAIDDGSAQVAVRLAEKLNLPVATSVVKLAVSEKTATVVREIDGGTEELEIPLPAVLTAQKGLNEPRYPSAMSIMKAKKKEIKTVTLADLGLDGADLAPKMKVEKYMLAEPRQTGRKLAGDIPQAVGELINILQTDIKAV
jgi:electron transfer flavoprotein beta subunit